VGKMVRTSIVLRIKVRNVAEAMERKRASKYGEQKRDSGEKNESFKRTLLGWDRNGARGGCRKTGTGAKKKKKQTRKKEKVSQKSTG